MQSVNCYYKRAKISEAKFWQLLRLFTLHLTASDAARLTGLDWVSTTQLNQRLRRYLVGLRWLPVDLQGTVETDESYFDPRRVRGKRDRGAGGETIVFGLFKRGRQVYVETYRIVLKQSRKRLCAATSIQKPSYHLTTAGAATTNWWT